MRRIIGLFITLFAITLCVLEIFGTYGYANKHIKDNNVIEDSKIENVSSNRKLTKGYIITIGVFSTIISLNIIYIIISCFCGKKAFDKKYKVLLYILFNVLLIPCLIMLFTSLGNKYLSNNKPPVVEEKEYASNKEEVSNKEVNDSKDKKE